MFFFLAISPGADFLIQIIDSANKAQDSYIKELDDGIPYDKLLDDLKRYAQYHSIEDVAYYEEILHDFMDAKHTYNETTLSIYKMIGYTEYVLKHFTELFNDSSEEVRFEEKRTLLSLLDGGINAMSKIRMQLSEVSSDMKSASEDMIVLGKRLNDDFNNKSEHFLMEFSRMKREITYDNRVDEIFSGAIEIERKLVGDFVEKLDNVRQCFDGLQSHLEKAQKHMDEVNAMVMHVIKGFDDLEIESGTVRVWTRINASS